MKWLSVLFLVIQVCKAQAGGLVLYENVSVCQSALQKNTQSIKMSGPIIIDITGGEMGDVVGETTSTQKPKNPESNPPDERPRLPELEKQIIPVVPEKKNEKKIIPSHPQNPFQWPIQRKKINLPN